MELDAVLNLILSTVTQLSPVAGEILRVSEQFSQVVAAALIASIWQSALLATCLLLSLKLAPRAGAGLRFAAWTSMLLILMTLPILSLASGTSISPLKSRPLDLPGHAFHPWLQLDARWSLVIAFLWLASSVCRALDFGRHSLRLLRLWQSATPADAKPLRVSGRRPVQVCTTPLIERPSVIGFFAPRILIPGWLYPRLSQAELDQVVLHETEHLRRRDDWTNLLQKLTLVLFPLNPVLVWIERQLCRERELACDEGVIRITQAPRAYAACLARLAERGLQHQTEALSLGVWHRRPELVHRVHSILKRRPVLGTFGARALLAVLGSGLLFGSIELSRAPQLVAFVAPVQDTQEAAHRKPGLLPESPVAEAVQLASTEESPRNVASRPGYRASAPRLTELKATLPVASQFVPTRKRHGKAAETSGRSADTSPQATEIASFVNGTRTNLAAVNQSQGIANPQAGEQWIVLTTWEQEPDIQASSGVIADFDQSSAEGIPAYRTTVTRLIFKVLPPETVRPTLNQPNTSHPAVLYAPVRSGWLFFQL